MALNTSKTQLNDEVVIREVAPDVWTFSRAFNLHGVPVGGRSTAIKLSDGGVWVSASTPLTDSTKAKLIELGEVKYIIAGNIFHHTFLAPYKTAFPDAKVIGPHGLNVKKESEGWQLHVEVGTSNTDIKLGFEDEIDRCYFPGHKNKDTAYYHKASKTVIASDLLTNLPGTEQYALSKSSPHFPGLSSMSPYGFLLKIFIWLKQDNYELMKRDVKRVNEWDFDRFILCHGDIVETGAKEAFRTAYSRYFD